MPAAARSPFRRSLRAALGVVVVTGAAAAPSAWRALAGAGDPGAPSTPPAVVGNLADPSYLDPNVAAYAPPSAPDQRGESAPEVVSAHLDGSGALLGGSEPAISGDGRLVAFTTIDASTGHPHVLVRDRTTGTLSDATVDLAGAPAGSSRHPALSADGCVLAVVTTEAYDHVAESPTSATWDVYRRRLARCRPKGTVGDGPWELLSRPDTAAFGSVDPDSSIAISADGSVVAFVARTGDRWHVMVADTPVGPGASLTVVAAPDLGGSSTDGPTRQVQPALSGDGASVAYVVQAPTSAGTSSAVVVWDRRSRLPEVISADADGRAVATGADQPSLGESGRYVAFVAPSTIDTTGALADRCRGCARSVFRVDRARPVGAPGHLVAVSLGAATVTDGDSWAPSLTLGGREVAYLTRSRRLAPAATGTRAVLVQTDLVHGTTSAITSEADSGRPAGVVDAGYAVSASAASAVVATASPDVMGATPVSDGTTQVVTVDLAASLSADDVDLGTVAVRSSATAPIVVTNAGPGVWPIPARPALAAPFSWVAGTCQPGTALGPGDSCTLVVRFAPRQPGPASAQVSLGGGWAPVVDVSGFAGPVELAASEPAPWPTTPVGASTRQRAVIDVRSAGARAVTVADVTLVGQAPGDFRIDADGCMSRRLTRTEGCSVVVEFAPTTSGHRSAALSVTSSDGTPVVVALDGTASYQPSLVLVGTSAQAGASVTVSGTGFPAAGDLSLSWDVGPTVTVHTDANGAFHTVVDTTAVSAGWREVIVSDEVPPGLDRRFAPVVSATVEIADGTAGGGANSAAFGA